MLPNQVWFHEGDAFELAVVDGLEHHGDRWAKEGLVHVFYLVLAIGNRINVGRGVFAGMGAVGV